MMKLEIGKKKGQDDTCGREELLRRQDTLLAVLGTLGRGPGVLARDNPIQSYKYSYQLSYYFFAITKHISFMYHYIRLVSF